MTAGSKKPPRRDGAKPAKGAESDASPAAPMQAPELDNRTAKRDAVAKLAFIAGLSEGLSVGGAAKVANIARSTAYAWRAADAAFAARWSCAVEEGTDALEDALRHEAIVSRNITAIIFALKARRPEKYKDRYEATVTDKPVANGAGDAAVIDGLNQLARSKQLEATIERLRQKYEPEAYRAEQEDKFKALVLCGRGRPVRPARSNPI